MAKKTIEDRLIDLKNAGIALDGASRIIVGENINKDKIVITASKEEVEKFGREIRCFYKRPRKPKGPSLKSFYEGNHWMDLRLTNNFKYTICNEYPTDTTKMEGRAINEGKEYELSQFW